MTSQAATWAAAGTRSRERVRWLAFVPAAIIYALVATWNIGLPGLYMDAVNPDYLVVKVLNPSHEPVVAWVLDGNYLLGYRLPVMATLYHGSQTFWLGLPLYALFGTTIEGLRLTHAVFALGVLAALFYLLRRAGLRPLVAGGVCTALALDPSFSYAFRTQSYITLAPAAWLLLSMALIMRDRDTPAAAWSWSGVLAGLAAGAYFIQAFFLLAVLPAVWIASAHGASPRLSARLRWIGGLLLGLSPVLLGYGLLIDDQGGLRETIRYFARQQAQLHAFSLTASLPERLSHMWAMLDGITSNAWNHAMMFGTWQGVPASALKTTLLVFVPVAAWILSELRGTASFAGRLFLALPVAWLAVALVFGNRLAGHHYVVLLPWLYAALALTLRDAAAQARISERLSRRFAAALLFVAVALNAAGQLAEARTLQRTGGVGLMSDAINRLADDLNAMSDKPFVFFPDWGLVLPVVFLTRGTVGVDSVEDYPHARSLLCAGRDVEVALISDRDARRAAWTRALNWDEPSVTPYRQRDGTVVFERLHYRGRKGDARCS